jgi:hypothetical protein
MINGGNMKKLVLVASLCVAAVMVAPIASASAESLAGACVIKGNATFEKGLSNGAPTANTYSFNSTEATCVSSKGVEPATATVSGKGLLGCAVAAGGLGNALVGETFAPGKGTLTVGGKKYPFELSFVAVAANVVLAVKPEGELGAATGDATFLTDGPEALEKCAKGTATELSFTAATAGVV